ncbi:MAG: helix-turn-helix transcriptional regulator [Gammaproteobacteria bacterium]|nr:helix-turn-helix transcriptional regulator [Gammaproteobacteria bacterium]
MEISNSINILSALAHESRLLIFKQLVQAGPEGLQPNSLSERLNMPAATLSFHLKELFHANLVSKNKQGRSIYYSAHYQTMDELIAYLKENCCTGSSC